MPHTEALRFASAGTTDATTIRASIDTGFFGTPTNGFISTPPIVQGTLGTPGIGSITSIIPEITRLMIDRLFQGENGVPAPLQAPVGGGLMTPVPGAPGGPMGPVLPSGTGGTFVGGRVPFITMPNGLPGCPTGYHPEKQGKPYCVRNRRMNPLNPRALSRATRRVGGFARAVKRARTLKKICRTL